MSQTFAKSFLHTGTYHSPDGTVVVTPDRLKHWAKQVKRVQSAGYAIPMHWDHSNDIELLEPIRLDTLHENKTRSAKNTVGKIVDFEVGPDGDHARITMEMLTDRAREAARSNTVSVSPVLFSKWKDGHGTVHEDTIGSIDLVDYPVDSSQSPFHPVPPSRPAEAVAMSCRVIRMSANPQRVYRMSTGENSQPGSDEPFGSEDAKEPTSDPQPDMSQNQDAPETKPTNTGGTSVADVVDLLSQQGIVLPQDTTTDNFLERLRPALLTAIAVKQQSSTVPATTLPPEQQPPMAPPGPMDQPVLSEQPQIAAMSALQSRISQLEAERVEATRQRLRDRIGALLTSGRCIPVEANAKQDLLRVQRLSVGADCKVDAGSLEVWIESRESLPQGACWDAEQRTQKMGARAIDAPTQHDTKGISQTREEEDDAVARLTRKHNARMQGAR